MEFALTTEQERELDRIVARYPNPMAALIPVLHLCQRINSGWISPSVIDFVATRLAVSAAHVQGVVTFYSLFNQEPPGKHQVWVCRSLSCSLRGAESLLAHCEKKLGVKAGGTTGDRRVTLRTAECLASCGTAPVIQVDDEYHEALSVEALDRILDRLLYED